MLLEVPLHWSSCESTSVNAGYYLVEAKQCFGWDASLASTTPKLQHVFSGEQANGNFWLIEVGAIDFLVNGFDHDCAEQSWKLDHVCQGFAKTFPVPLPTIEEAFVSSWNSRATTSPVRLHCHLANLKFSWFILDTVWQWAITPSLHFAEPVDPNWWVHEWELDEALPCRKASSDTYVRMAMDDAMPHPTRWGIGVNRQSISYPLSQRLLRGERVSFVSFRSRGGGKRC